MKASLRNIFSCISALVLSIPSALPVEAAPGDLDTTFPGHGKFSFGLGRAPVPALATAIQADGKIIVAASSFSSGRPLAVVRYNLDGSRDTTFGGDGEVVTPVAAAFAQNQPSGLDVPAGIAVTPDGKILVGGTAFVDGAPEFFLVRYHPDGELDESFGFRGKTSTALPVTGVVASDLVLQADGRIVMAGPLFALSGNGFTAARFNANGSLDRTFGDQGAASAIIGVGSITKIGVAVQSDNKVVVATSLSGENAITGYRVFRFTAAGQPDKTFDLDGNAYTNVGADDFVAAVAIQPGTGSVLNPDKIVVSGFSLDSTGEFFSAVRYNLDGTPDNSFGASGIVRRPIPGMNVTRALDVAIEQRGFATRKIVLAGWAAPSSAPGALPQFALMRLNANGTLDSTLGGTGIVLTSFRGEEKGLALAVAGDKIVVAGESAVQAPEFSYDAAIVRYNSIDGALDATFGVGGKKIDDIGSLPTGARAAAIQPDGKIVLGGTFNNLAAATNFALARLNPDGTLDSSFSEDGTVVSAAKGAGNAVALQPDSKILLAGTLNGTSQTKLAVTRYNPDGSLDGNWFASGVAALPGTQYGASGANAIAVQTDGSFFVVGYGTRSSRDTIVVRFGPTGGFDGEFGNDAAVFESLGNGDDEARAVAIQPDGKIVIAGVAAGGNGKQAYVARLTAKGLFDDSFGENGRSYIPFPQGQSEANSVAVDSLGRIVVAGFVATGSDHDFAVARLTPGGVLDLNFNGTGMVTTPIGVGDDRCNAVLVQADGRIIAAGTAIPNSKNGTLNGFAPVGDYAVVRYNDNGSLDSTYGSNGKRLIDFERDAFDTANAVVLDSAARALVVGESTGLFGIARLDLGQVVPTPTPAPSATPTPAPTATPVPNRFANISTRLRVETGENVLIGGFIVTGSMPKRIIIRALGPSLPVQGALANPVLELFDGNGQFVGSNDNWQEATNKQEIIDSTIAPPNEFESAILREVAPGAYTAVVRDAADGAGVGLIEIYDLGAAQDAKLANISTRGRVLTGESVMIGGLIVTGSSPQKVIVRAIGPSLPVNGRLEDPVLELFDSNGTLLSSNDNWKDAQQSEIEATTIPPSNDLEAAIVASLPPAAYTAIVRGVNDTTGVALVEAYALE